MDKEVLDAAARSVLTDKTQQWRRLVFEAALAMQARNPDMRAMALLGPSDNVAAGERLVALIAVGMHPQAIWECISWCEFVETHLADHPVVPPEYNRGVDGDELGRPVDVDRLAALEEKCERIESLIARLLDDSAAVERLRSVLRSDRGDGLLL